MAPGGTRSVELVKLLHATAQPIYVLDDERTLVFCNQALLDWTGQSADELLGKSCTYHSDPSVTGPEAVAADLCPPPAALAGEETTGIVLRADPSGNLSRRQARFLPLRGNEDELAGILAIVETDDLPETEAPQPSQSEAEWLHEKLQAFHRQMAARLRADRLVGESLAIRRVRSQVTAASQTSASVLIVGPPGSGRQRVAEAIHHCGDAPSAGALIPLACSLLAPELIVSTIKALAMKQPPPGHALLLNDADCLAPEVQPALAELFSHKSWSLRLIATARCGLEEAAAEEGYHPNLAMLLSTMVISLPPLAERREDIPLLAQRSLEQCNARGKRQLAGFAPEAMDRLCAYSWPGNADELAAMVTEAHRRAEGTEIAVADLPEQIHLAAAAAAHPRRVEETIVLDEYLARIERELIVRALARSKGNKAKAARLLGMTRPRLYRRLVQLGLEE